MKQKLLLFAFTLFLGNAIAQSGEPYDFKEYKRYAATPVKSQDQTGTCWAFSTASFLESEALRHGKGETDLSEMFVVRNIYRLKCENYIRRQGAAQFGEGGLAHDYLNAVKQFGIVPDEIYPGRKDPNKPFNHSQLVKNLQEKCKEYIEEGKKGKLDPRWSVVIDSILDAEFGEVPRKFTYHKAVFSPQSYRDFLGINPDDYVTVTSFTHHPFWTSFILEIPDNWSNGSYYNLPLDDFMRCLTYALEKGYTLAWDADVSNTGFSANNGLAIVPKVAWQDKTASERANAFKFWEPQQQITQESRQKLFDSQETTDDHLMHIVGVLDEKHTGLYYVVKNSWGQISDLKGYVYASDAYMRENSISFTLPKEAIPQDLRRRLGLEPGEVNIEKAHTPDMDVKPAQNQQANQVAPSDNVRLKTKQNGPVMRPTPKKD